LSKAINIVWSRRSQFDIERLYRFLLPETPRSARRAINEIHRSVLRLAAFPQSGRPIAELEGNRRELLIPFGDSGYALIYLFDGTTVEILSIKHQREAGY